MIDERTFEEYGMAATLRGHELKAGSVLVKVEPASEGDGYDVRKFSDNVEHPDVPYRTIGNVDAGTALAAVRSTVNGERFDGTGVAPEDGFLFDGVFVTDAFADLSGRFSVDDPEATYGDAYREWRDNPPVPDMSARP